MYDMTLSLIETIVVIGMRNKKDINQMADEIGMTRKDLYRLLEMKREPNKTQEKYMRKWIEENTGG